MSKVVIKADKQGSIINVYPNKPEYGSIRVEQILLVINDRGWLRKAKRSAFIKGKIEDLLECNYKDGDKVNGKIVVVESLIPPQPDSPEKNLKMAGDTGVVCTIDGQPIYRECYFTPNEDARDEFIAHDNSTEIKQAQSASKTMSLLSKNIDADL